MKKRFTPAEFLVVICSLAALAALISGMTPRKTARAVGCCSKLHGLLKLAQMYTDDHRGMWMATCNTNSTKSYVHRLAAGKYLKTPWDKLMTERESEITCPELPRVDRYKVIQGYGSVYNNGSSYDPQRGLYIHSPEYAFIRSGAKKIPVSPAQRIWFADTLNILKPPYPSTLLFGFLPSYMRGGESFGAVNLTHSGYANIGAVDGSVAAVRPEEFKRYYLPRTGNDPLRHQSVPLRLFLDNGVPREVKR